MNRLLPRRDVPIDYLMALRGAAVIGVLLGHLLGIGGLSLGGIASKSAGSWSRHTEYFEPWRSALEIATPIVGANFVMLFFVLSGYLMGKVFFEGRYDAVAGKRAFYRARYLRLAPLLYFNLLICIALVPFADLSPVMMAGDFLFVNNFTGRGINLVTWSLSHEMQYYLLAPFVFLLFREKGRLAFPAAVALAVFAFFVGWFVGPIQFIGSFLAGFAVNLLKLPPISLGAKRLGFVIGLALLHFAYNALYFFHFDRECAFLAIVVSAGLVAVCEMPLKAGEGHAPLVLRLAVLTAT